MITQAIYDLLNVTSITDLVGTNIAPVVATPGIAFPWIVFNERGVPEDFKKGTDNTHSIISEFTVQVDIYCSKGKDGNGGFLECNTIGDAVKDILDGLLQVESGGVNIEQVVLREEQNIYDPISEAARQILEFNFRVRPTDINGTNFILTEAGDDLITEAGDNLIRE